MFHRAKRILFGAALAAAAAFPALAADFIEPPIVEAPPPAVVYEEPDVGGWYIRGDVDYSWMKFRGADYSVVTVDCCGNGRIVGGNALEGKLRSSFSLGGGIGYQITRHLRTDLTLDWQSKSKFNGRTECGANCFSTDLTSLTALSLLANAYVDLGTWNRVTPYVGAGIGGSHVKWDNLQNTECNAGGCGATFTHEGYKEWRFAWALMAGASVEITHNLSLDLGYKYQRVAGGRMFGFDNAPGGPFTGHGRDKGIDFHSVRAGLRYSFGAPAKQVAYDPEPMPVYK